MSKDLPIIDFLRCPCHNEKPKKGRLMVEPVAEERIPSYCALCRSRCGCIATVRAGRLLRIEPDATHPTGAALCAKGIASPGLIDDPARLLFPMRRTRP